MSPLAASYRTARALNRSNGHAHWLGVLALPRAVRYDVRAVYGFVRLVDDLVDAAEPSNEERARSFDSLAERLMAGLAAGRAEERDLAAVVDAATRWNLGGPCFERFFHAMRMDLGGHRYESDEDLIEYLDGAALAPADMVLPMLDPVDLEQARPAAHDLASAMHLADLLVDVTEDLDRGRCYLPRCALERYGAGGALSERRITDGWMALAGSISRRARDHLDRSAKGVYLLPSRSARYVRCAQAYTRARLDAVEAGGFDVFRRPIEVPLLRKVAILGSLAVPAVER